MCAHFFGVADRVMGNANCVVVNDEDKNVQLTASNYSNGICSLPVWTLILRPGETKPATAGPDFCGLTVSHSVNGSHAIDKDGMKRQNGSIVKLSSIFRSGKTIFVRCENQKNGISFFPPSESFSKGGAARMAVVYGSPERQVSAHRSNISKEELQRQVSARLNE